MVGFSDRQNQGQTPPPPGPILPQLLASEADTPRLGELPGAGEWEPVGPSAKGVEPEQR